MEKKIEKGSHRVDFYVRSTKSLHGEKPVLIALIKTQLQVEGVCAYVRNMQMQHCSVMQA